MKVLIINDEPLVREGIARAIRSERFEITECSLGADALEEICRSHYEPVFY